jgi:acyl carrier protein
MTLEDIQRMVAVQLGVAKVAPDDRLVEDLGAESVDVVNLLAAVESRFGIAVDEAELADVRTVADVYAFLRSRLL